MKYWIIKPSSIKWYLWVAKCSLLEFCPLHSGIRDLIRTLCKISEWTMPPPTDKLRYHCPFVTRDKSGAAANTSTPHTYGWHIQHEIGSFFWFLLGSGTFCQLLCFPSFTYGGNPFKTQAHSFLYLKITSQSIPRDYIGHHQVR